MRYEDLAREPARTARRVCTILGEKFDEGMLETSRSAVDVGSQIEPYKAKVSAPADASRALAWRQTLGSADVALCDGLLRDALIDLGYPTPGAENSAEVRRSPFEHGAEMPALLDVPRCPSAEDLELAWR